MGLRVLAAWLLLVFPVAGCAGAAVIDRSFVNQPAMDVREANLLGAPSPSTGLRNLKKSSGTGACAVCAH
jgi:hypothetical protein